MIFFLQIRRTTFLEILTLEAEHYLLFKYALLLNLMPTERDTIVLKTNYTKSNKQSTQSRINHQSRFKFSPALQKTKRIRLHWRSRNKLNF